jgi:CRP-like cAMP-binding protein
VFTKAWLRTELYNFFNMSLNLLSLISLLDKTDRSDEDLAFIREAVATLEDFNYYIQQQSASAGSQLLRALRAELHPKNTVVFSKGDPCNKLYVVCSGTLDLCEVKENGEKKSLVRLVKGNLIGERHLLRRRPRLHTAIVHSDAVLLTVTAQDFRRIFEASMRRQLEEKRKFLLQHLPCMELYSELQLENFASIMDLDVKRKGEVVVHTNETYEYMCFVKEGTAAVVNDAGFTRSVVIKLEAGSAVADECALLNLKSKFTVIVQSDIAKFYKSKRSDFLGLVLMETFQQLKQCCRYKLESHLQLKTKSTQRLPSILAYSPCQSSLSLASPQAKKSMQRNSSLNQTQISEDSINDTDFARCKLKLESLRDCTISRLKKFSPEASRVKRYKLRRSLPRLLK